MIEQPRFSLVAFWISDRYVGYLLEIVPGYLQILFQPFQDFRTIRQSPWIGSLLQTGGKIIQGFSQSVDKSGQVIRLELDRLTGWIIGDRC